MFWTSAVLLRRLASETGMNCPVPESRPRWIDLRLFAMDRR
jgi:hypothetical protein